MRSISQFTIAFNFIIAASASTTADRSRESSTTTTTTAALRIPGALLQSSLSRHLATMTMTNDHGQEHDTLASSSSSCQSDMIELERNTDLSDSLQSALNSFSSDFNSNPLEYCHSSTSSNIISSSTGRGERNLDCFVDFEVFSSEYKSICRYNEAEHFPITIFMQCSSMSTNVNLEMELANIPTCLAHRCDRVEVGIALDRLLSESNEQPKSSSSSSTNGGGGGTFGGFSCTMYKKVNHYNQASSSATSISNLGVATATIFFGVLNLMLLGI